MFTGLVQALGTVRLIATLKSPANTANGSVVSLEIDPGDWAYRPDHGDSIAIDGCCLTLASSTNPRGRGSPRLWTFHVVAETLKKTTLGRLRPGDTVNLEHAARADTMLGGHIVQGHVDGVGTVTRVQTGADWRVWVEVPSGLDEFLAPQGSVCVSGVSLTVAEIWQTRAARGFAVALIPTTLDKTNLAALKPGDPVNLEMDILAKTIVRWLKVYGNNPKNNHKGTKTRRGNKSKK